MRFAGGRLRPRGTSNAVQRGVGKNYSGRKNRFVRISPTRGTAGGELYFATAELSVLALKGARRTSDDAAARLTAVNVR